MIFRIPVYVTNDRQTKGQYVAQCLFAPAISRRDDNLNRLMSKLARDISRQIEKLGKGARHDAVGMWAFCPTLTQHRLTLDIELRRRKGKEKALFVVFRHMGRRIVFTPSHPELWFEIDKQADLHARATEILTEHWREREREDEEDCHPEKEGIEGKAWVQVLRLSASVTNELPKETDLRFLNIGGDAATDGQMELHRVGRCLDWQYPDELDRAVLREAEVNELNDLLESSERRPLLLVGPRQSGKTTLIHEVVHRRVAKRNSPFVNRDNVWLISPQRLISGMSYVGQWEGRLLAILKHAKKRRHVLYFDDLVGLFLAGISASSTLSAAQVLKPYLERREIRVLGEITPEALRVLQERDRSFADLFHILPVREPGDADTMRMLINIQRRLEGKHSCGFNLDVLPAVIDLQRRYDRATAFPGKAARMLTRLAVKGTVESVSSIVGRIFQMAHAAASPFHPKRLISREEVFNEFAAQSGLAKSFLDKTEKLERDKIIEELSKQVIGQPQAVEAAADVIAVAKARLNDPDRPLAAFLFLGPTGVGKTECAKAIARYLFADAERLLRFDMNEYLDPGSATRLVGTFRQPEGLLTAAIRRQPFAVVLLDEIEKADPEVFDLLLQVLGEGRLTDSLGRTADFTNAIIILTSNLGVREAEAQVGFGEVSDKAAPSYTRAAELFFRPEFFNRLDRVIPFRRLTREHTRKIAERIVTEVLEREGFRQRRCILNVSPAAFEQVIDAGYDPLMGARAMKRSVERHLTQPAAVRLAGLPIDQFTIVTVFAANERTAEATPGGPGLRVDVQPLRRAEPLPPSAATALPPMEHLGALEERLESIEELLNQQKPDGDVSSGHVTTAQERYYTLRDSMHALGRELDALFDRHENNRVAKLEATIPASVAKKTRFRAMKVRPIQPGSSSFNNQYFQQPSSSTKNAEDLGEEIRQLVESAEDEAGDAEILHLERRIALLEHLAALPPEPRPAYLWLRHAPNQRTLYPAILAEAYFEGLIGELGLQLTKLENAPGLTDNDIVIRLDGLGARMIAECEAGTHLFCPAHGSILPVRVACLDAWPPPKTLDPFHYDPIIRIYTDPGSVVDLRTGIVTPMKSDGLGDAFETIVLTTITREKTV
ncbi:AAA family ATPase [Zavarzinella formosa]|uniref:AAA family ATPase n=1 Tax=Zavarzinella formosa TaxID=360055 RepID=UPI000304D4B5|nr:AAA family ATPase [Zavarzinella formosa]